MNRLLPHRDGCILSLLLSIGCGGAAMQVSLGGTPPLACEPGSPPTTSSPAAQVGGRPRIRWPLREGYRRLYPDKAAVLQTRHAPPADRCGDFFLTYAGGNIEALHSRTGQPLWPALVPSCAEPLLLDVDEERCLFAAPRQVFALGVGDGRRQWRFGDDSPDDPLVDPESQLAISLPLVAGDSIICLYGRELTALDRRLGTSRWRHDLSMLREPAWLAAGGGEVFCLVRGKDRFLLSAFSADTGRLLGEAFIDAQDDRPIALRPVDTGRCVVAFSRSFSTLDTRGRGPPTSVTVDSPLRPAGLHVIAGGLVVVDGDGAVSRYEPPLAKPVWISRPAASVDSGPWSDVAGKLLVVAGGRTVAAIDAVSGTRRWRRNLDVPVTTAQLELTNDSLLICVPDAQPETSSSAPRYRLRRLSLADGRDGLVSRDGDLVTRPMSSFSGLYLHDGALILLDGRNLVGYVGDADNRGPRSAGN